MDRQISDMRLLIFCSVSSAGDLGTYVYTISPLRDPAVKNSSLYLPIDLPNRCPSSIRYICAHKSIKPLGDGVPVKPTTRGMNLRTFLRALKRLLA